MKSWEPLGGSEDLWEEQEHHGPFAGLIVRERREHDGKRWMVLVSPEGWALEVELTRNRPFDVRPLPRRRCMAHRPRPRRPLGSAD